VRPCFVAAGGPSRRSVPRAPADATPLGFALLVYNAAIGQYAALDEFRRRLPDLMGLRKDLPRVDFRLGIATGEGVVDTIGSDLSRCYTMIGDTVNLGSRLEGVNKVYGTRILICARTRELAGDAIETREVDTVTVVGKTEPVQVFELSARSGDARSSAPPSHRAAARGMGRELAAHRQVGLWR